MRYATALRHLEERSFATYRARIQASKRLRACGYWWDAAQISLTSALLSVSIAFLGSPEKMLPGSGIALAVLSVLALVVSITTANLEYSSRSKDMFRSYREFQAYSAKIERLRDTRVWVSSIRVRGLSIEHQHLLDVSENHTTHDFLVSQAGGKPMSLPLGLVIKGLRPYLLPSALVLASMVMVWVIVGQIAIPLV